MLDAYRIPAQAAPGTGRRGRPPFVQ